MHMFVGSINKGIRMNGYITTGLVDVADLHSRHLALVDEMERRGYKHKSELPSFEWKPELRGNIIDIPSNEKELKRRCKDCRF